MQATTRIHKQILWLCVLTIAATSTLWAGNMESSQKKEITRSYPVNSNTVLSVDNRFGNIVIEHWDKKEVEFRIVIESKAKNISTAAQNLDKVSVDFSKRSSAIEATTQMDNLNQRDNERVTVDYTILAPKDIKLDLKQQFGNINLPERNEGTVSLEIKFGNLAGGSFTSLVSVESQFSNVTLGNLVTADLELKHSGKVIIGDARNITVECSFSNLKANAVGNMELDEKHSGVNIKECEAITMRVQHSSIDIGKLSRSAEVESLSHSTLTIGNLSPDFDFIAAEASFGTLKIKTPASSSFLLDANTSFGDVKLSSAFNLSNVTRIEKNNKKDINAKVNGGGNSRIEFNGNFSTLSIKEL